MSIASRSPGPPAASRRWIHSTRLQLLLFGIIPIVGPFVMLRRYLQDAIGRLSRWSVPVGPIDVVVVPFLAVVALVVALILARRHLTRRRVAAGLIALGMIAAAQQVADYYFLTHSTDIQQNWHYLAYMTFAVMFYRDLVPRPIPLARIIVTAFLISTAWSAVDEGFQMFINARVFDLGDIAKDSWGSVTGLALLFLGENPRGAILSHWRPLRQRRLSDYARHPASALLLCAVLAFLFLCFASILSEPVYAGQVVGLTLASFAVLLLAFHASQFRAGKIAVSAVLILAIGAQAAAFLRYRNAQILSCRPNLLVYKGIPVPYFDVLIKPSGALRLVDKKEHFYARDRQALLSHGADIIVVGSGMDGSGGRGFPEEAVSQFNYDPFRKDATQVVIQPNPQACLTFNRLKGEGRHVLLVLHNTR